MDVQFRWKKDVWLWDAEWKVLPFATTPESLSGLSEKGLPVDSIAAPPISKPKRGKNKAKSVDDSGAQVDSTQKKPKKSKSSKLPSQIISPDVCLFHIYIY